MRKFGDIDDDDDDGGGGSFGLGKGGDSRRIGIFEVVEKKQDWS